MARANAVDLVEIAPNATPPVCRLVDYGKFRYEQSKKDKESKKHQHATRVKEVQLSPKIDPHDLATKVEHAIDFLAEDMKVKISLRFRGREMAHTEFGFQVIQKFLAEISAYGHPDFQPKLIGRGINVMISPLPRNKRPKGPREGVAAQAVATAPQETLRQEPSRPDNSIQIDRGSKPQPGDQKQGGFSNSPFAALEIK
jgi:translation initiation factor IF-3